MMAYKLPVFEDFFVLAYTSALSLHNIESTDSMVRHSIGDSSKWSIYTCTSRCGKTLLQCFLESLEHYTKNVLCRSFHIYGVQVGLQFVLLITLSTTASIDDYKLEHCTWRFHTKSIDQEFNCSLNTISCCCVPEHAE